MDKIYFSSYVIFFTIIFALILSIFEIFLFKSQTKSPFNLVQFIIFCLLNSATIFIIYLSIKGNFYSGGAIASGIILIISTLIKIFFLSEKFSSNIIFILLLETGTIAAITLSTFALEKFILTISSTPETVSSSIQENNLFSLRLNMWLGGDYLFLKEPANIASRNNNFDALKILLSSSNDPDILLHALEGNPDRNNDWKIIKLMIDYGKEHNTSKKICFYYSLNYSANELKYCLENGYKIKDYPDAILEAIERHNLVENKNKIDDLKKKIDILL